MTLASLATLLACAERAHASPLELLSRIALHPSDPNLIALSYEEGGQGLLYSRDGGQHFALRCGSSISSSFTNNGHPISFGGDGRLLIGFFTGMTEDDGAGCGWNEQIPAVSGVQVADFVRHPGDPAVTFLVTANPSRGQRTGLLRRNADGSLDAVGASDTSSSGSATFYATRLALVALPGGGLRFFESGGRATSGDEFEPVVRWSDDLASTWTTHVVSSASGARLLLLGVDPTHPERILLAIDRDQAADEVLYSPDGGATSTPYLELFEFGAATVAQDGRWWVGDRGGPNELSEPGALWSGAGFGAPPEKLASYGVRCLARRAEDDTLFACRRSEFGTISAAGEFSIRMSFGDIENFVSCAGEDLALGCQQQLCKNWCGPLHFAQAPLCDAYDEESPLCGVAARAYGRAPTAAGSPGESAAAADAQVPPSIVAPGAAATASAPSAGSAAAGCQIGAVGGVSPLGSSERARLLLAASGVLCAAHCRLGSRRGLAAARHSASR